MTDGWALSVVRARHLAWRVLLVGLPLGVFLATRLGLYATLSPFFDADTYKYFGAADSLWAGNGWPPVFLKMHDGGGALHAVPGYTWFMLGVWQVLGQRALSEVVVVQAAVSLLAFGATAVLVARWYGLAAASLALLLLALSPSLGWMDHLLMPESLGTGCFLLAMWAVARVPAGAALAPGAILGAIVAGLLSGFGVLLRSSSQVFVPFPVVLVTFVLRSPRLIALWTLVYLVAFFAPLTPWMDHNQRIHGRWVVATSTGRNLYFSGVWTNAIDRGEEMRDLGENRPVDVNSSYYLLDARFETFLKQGMDIAEADQAMGRLALQEYRQAGVERYFSSRLANLVGLFESEAFGRKNLALTDYLEWYLNDGGGSEPIRTAMERRWAYQLTPEAVDLMNRTRTDHKGPKGWFRWWVEHLIFDGIPLAVAFVVSTALLLLRWRAHGLALLCWALPVYAYLAMYTIFGAPLYRYQSTVHAPMLVVVSLALWQVAAFLAGSRYMNPEMTISMRTAGSFSRDGSRGTSANESLGDDPDV